MQCQRNKICMEEHQQQQIQNGEEEATTTKKHNNYVVVRAQFSVRDFVKMVCAVPDRWMCHICFEWRCYFSSGWSQGIHSCTVFIFIAHGGIKELCRLYKYGVGVAFSFSLRRTIRVCTMWWKCFFLLSFFFFGRQQKYSAINYEFFQNGFLFKIFIKYQIGHKYFYPTNLRGGNNITFFKHLSSQNDQSHMSTFV